MLAGCQKSALLGAIQTVCLAQRMEKVIQRSVPVFASIFSKHHFPVALLFTTGRRFLKTFLLNTLNLHTHYIINRSLCECTDRKIIIIRKWSNAPFFRPVVKIDPFQTSFVQICLQELAIENLRKTKLNVLTTPHIVFM